MRKYLFKKMSVFFCVALFALCVSAEAKREYSKVVQELQELYNTDEKFAEVIDNALSSAISPLDGWSVNPAKPEELFIWTEKDINDLLDLFEDWRTFVPSPSNGMDYYVVLYGLCYENVNALKFVNQEPGLSWTKKYVEARGDYMDSKDSIDDHRSTMAQWFKAMGPAWDDFNPPHPVDEGYKGYTTFNEFFTRNIKVGARPIVDEADPSILAAPADGLVNVINENLNTQSKIHTKYQEYLNVDQLLNGSEYAAYFIGGTAAGTVLLPPDYHHYHSPVEGKVVEAKAVDSEGGVYFGMDGQFFTYSNNGNVGGYMSDYGVFGVYHRGYYIIKTKQLGYVAMIAVGLDDISSINFVDKFKPEVVAQGSVDVEKGEKLGHFAYGGSTVILLFEPGVYQGTKLKQGVQAAVLKLK